MTSNNDQDNLASLPPHVVYRMTRPNTDFLQEVPLFRGLPESQLEVINRLIELRTYAPDDAILIQGQVNSEIFFVRYGIASVMRQDTPESEANTFAYLHEDDIFGETGLFADGDHHATASVTAFTEVSVFVMQHTHFIKVLNDYHPAALEVARILTERLHFTSDKLIRDPNDRQVHLVIGVGSGAGATMFGSALTTSIAHANPEEATVYTEHPRGKELPAIYQIDTDRRHYRHEAGYDLYIPFGLPRLVTSLQLNLIWERLEDRYKNIIISVPSRILEDAGDLLEQVSSVAIIAHPDQWKPVTRVRQLIHDSPFIKTNNILTVANHSEIVENSAVVDSPFDFIIPHIIELPPVLQTVNMMPRNMLAVMDNIRKRLSIENQVSVYVPETAVTTIERVLWLFKSHFAETEIEQERLSETFYVIRSYVDRDTLNQHWQEFIKEVATCKAKELETPIAIEINHHLSLV